MDTCDIVKKVPTKMLVEDSLAGRGLMSQKYGHCPLKKRPVLVRPEPGTPPASPPPPHPAHTHPALRYNYNSFTCKYFNSAGAPFNSVKILISNKIQSKET